LEYRRLRGLGREELRAAVLVQRMVPADASAVAFTADPVTGSREEVVIEASWGLGESIVGGTVTPDTYRVRKAGLAVATAETSEKRRMTVPACKGTLEVDVPRFLRSQPALGEEQAVEVARLGIDLETEMGRPVDVECAYVGGRLYLLQCRPITAVIARVAG
jgi:pyruvate,water dikinase